MMGTRTVCFAFLFLLSGCQNGPAVRPVNGSEVERTFERFIHAFNDLDWETFSELLSPEVSLFNPQTSTTLILHRLDGKDQVATSFQRVFDAARSSGDGPNISPHNVRIQHLPDAAIVTFEFPREGGSFGRRTLVFIKTAAGWKLVHLHASNTNPDDA